MEETHHPFFCCSKWYLSSFLNQSSTVEILVFGKYQNYSCQHFFFFILVCLLASANIIWWIQLHSRILLTNQIWSIHIGGGKKQEKCNSVPVVGILQVLFMWNRLRNITGITRWAVPSMWHTANFNSILRATGESNSSPCRKLHLNLQNKAL